MQAAVINRADIVRQGRHLQYITIAYNSGEALASLIAGLIAGSVSLIGFGLDSLIEVTSGAALLWRLGRDADVSQRHKVERTSLRVVGACFLALAAYITYEAAESLLTHEPPRRSIPGIVIAAVSIIAMPLLASAKRRVAHRLDSRAMLADSRQTDFCAYLSAILLGGLLLNATLGWWWADPAAALIMVPIIAREGIRSLKGDACGCP
jgi:divalent metal cation (Fe/Co/Zn/Cd) transporter